MPGTALDTTFGAILAPEGQNNSESETSPRRSRQSFTSASEYASASPPTSARSSSASSVSPDGVHRRKSVFTEIGLDDFDKKVKEAPITELSRPRKVRFRSRLDIHEAELAEEEELLDWTSEEDTTEGTTTVAFPIATATPTSPFPSMPRIFLLVFVLAFIIPTLHNSPWLGKGGISLGAKAGVIRKPFFGRRDGLKGGMERRDDSPTVICKRWSQQAAVVNGTMYLYGGQLTTDASQSDNTWNNDLVTLDLTKDWQISSPTLKGLAQPSGPPAVANGYLWNSDDSLYLYGGEFSDNPVASPAPFSLWEYQIKSSSWTEHQNPQTTEGQNSDVGNQPVQRAAEGAGLNVPELGRGFYFGGHLDGYTTEGWSQSIARVYLKSMIEFTFPGQSNPSVDGGKAAGSDGLWRNITEGGLQDSAGFTERADGVLVYVPGFGKEGIILGLGGGTNATFTQMNIIDVFDVSSSTWYKQATSGTTPEIRVNPCAVAASAADGSSTQVYMYGGQNLIPYGSQTQYDDMWILTIPSFTWIKVNTDNQSVPPARAGHSCTLWNGQMIVVGGYVGKDLSCDTPGIYVFDASKLTWQNQYNALHGGNELNQQASQQKDNTGLSGSYGYMVPEDVQSVIGGNELGKATVTAPAQSATAGPLATGKPVTYTVTQSNGAVVTETGPASTTGAGSTPSSGSDSGSHGHNVAAIVAGVIAGCLAILAAYLGFCAWLYRRQLTLYKNHVAMAQRAHTQPEKLGTFGNTLSSQPSEQSSGKAVRISGDRESGPSRSSHSHTQSDGSNTGLITAPGYQRLGGVGGTSSRGSSTDDLMAGQEPSFLGVMLNPRRSLRVINRD